MPAARREELLRWIAQTRTTRRRLRSAVSIGAAVGIGLLFYRGAVGGLALVIVGIVALCGFWITSSHLLDWETQLAELDRPQQRTPGRYQR